MDARDRPQSATSCPSHGPGGGLPGVSCVQQTGQSAGRSKVAIQVSASATPFSVTQGWSIAAAWTNERKREQAWIVRYARCLALCCAVMSRVHIPTAGQLPSSQTESLAFLRNLALSSQWEINYQFQLSGISARRNGRPVAM